MIDGRPSAHLMKHRADRVAFIATTIGYGNIIHERVGRDNKGGTCLMCITDTGVLILKSVDGQSIITMYICSLHQARTVYDDVGGMIPVELFRKIKKNEPLRVKQNEVTYK